MRGLIIILAFIALVGGGGYGLRTYAPQLLPNAWTTDDVLRDRLRERFAEDGRADAFFTKFEELFPADYAELMDQLVVLYRRNGTPEQGGRLAQSYMRSFIEDNVVHVTAAEPEVLVALAAALAEATSALREEDPELCAQTFRRSRGFLAPTTELSDQTQGALIRVTNAMLDGIASGKRAPTQYPEPTEGQWAAWLDRYLALGGDEEALIAFGSNRALLPTTVCTVAAHLWTAVTQAEDDFTPRFVSYSMRQS